MPTRVRTSCPPPLGALDRAPLGGRVARRRGRRARHGRYRSRARPRPRRPRRRVPPPRAGRGGRRRRHGRARTLPRALLVAPAQRGAGRRAAAAGRRGDPQGGRRAGAALARRRALLRRPHARHRHALALDEAGRARRGEPPQARGLATCASATRCAMRAGSRACRCTRCARPTRTGASSASPSSSRSAASRRPRTCWPPIATPTTAPRPRPTPSGGRGSCAELAALGGEVGLHGSYRSGDDEALLRAERHDLEVLLGRPVRGLRFHYLRMRWHEVVGRLDRLGIEYDTTLGFSDRPGPRAGFSFPFRPWDHATGTTCELPRAAAAADGRDAGGVALHGPLAVARPQGGRRRARSPRGRRRRRGDPLAQRPLRPRLRARLGRRLRAPARRHRRRAAARPGTGAALCDWWKAERCAS